MRKWIPYIIVALAVAASLLQFSQLPDRMPTHWGVNGEVNGWSSRLWGAFTLPLVLLLLATLMKWLPKIDPRRANYPKFAGTFEAIFIAIMLLLLAMHVALLAAALGYPIRFERWVPVGIGLLLVVLGNLLPRARPNWFIGVRTPWTLSSDRVWEKTHRLAGYVFVIAGIVVMITGISGVRFAPFLMGPVIGIAALSLVVYSYVEWRREGSSSRLPLVFLIAAAIAAPSSVSAQTALAMVDTIAPSTVRESSYSITSGLLSLPGTLTLPALPTAKMPVVLIVAGSGPTDRNGNSIAPGYAGPLPHPNMYAQLAWRLAELGIASVRYDKRSLGGNQARIVIAKTSIDDFIGDVAAGAKQLSTDMRFSRVVLLGHSEGAELVLQAANRGAAAAGIVMASGAGRRFLPILHEQLSRQLPPAMLLEYDSAMAAFLRGETPATALPAALTSLLQPDNRLFMQGMQRYIPAEEIARAKFPILIVQGANDGQIGIEEDARALAAAQPAAKLVILPTANHVLKAATSPALASQVPLYMDPRIPIVPDIAPAIAAWIKERN